MGRTLELKERIDLASEHKNFDPTDFGIGNISEEAAHEVCDLYGVPRVVEDIDDGLWDHYSGLPNPMWYAKQNNEK
jgi:hypothetical protein